MAYRRENALIAFDRDVAEALFGRRRGRPTISRRAGAAIGRTIGVSSNTGTDIFHFGLFVGAIVLATKASGS